MTGTLVVEAEPQVGGGVGASTEEWAQLPVGRVLAKVLAEEADTGNQPVPQHSLCALGPAPTAQTFRAAAALVLRAPRAPRAPRTRGRSLARARRSGARRASSRGRAGAGPERRRLDADPAAGRRAPAPKRLSVPDAPRPTPTMKRASAGVLAVDIFDKFSFTRASVARFDALHKEFPGDLESSISFPADFLKPPEEKGRTA
ncbi:uncharacterized protein LOC117096527 [Trachypithecus francoisi]|uniref:uncharacterized protein LOC117096527 n=1 Tax=Trachypithecus francoisi TaxID=54180 RepID=UPI00141AE4EA|nr:uncharacterized protein LOC117096527 [Trachypithecus francoisi]